MHSCETLPTPPAASGPSLLLQLGRLIMRSRSPAPRPDRIIKVVPAKPSTSTQVQTQPKPAEDLPKVEAQLNDHVNALWNDQLPVCIEVLLAPDCQECYTSLCREDSAFDKHKRALLLERWSIQAQLKKGDRAPAFSTSQWLLNAVRSQLHFSQLSAWLSRLNADTPDQRRRKLSHETCNFKKLEGNCDKNRNLYIVYSIQSSDTTKPTDFNRPPTDHKFPLTDIGNNLSLNITLQSLPRIDEIPSINCSCPKRKTSRDIPVNIHEEIVGKLNDLTLDKKLVDDRMHTPCSENGKHKCYCDDESDSKDRKKEDKRLKEIAKHKRKMRKECKLKKLHDSTSSEGDKEKLKETHTSIPILQAARFDRFRAIGCYRNQTYLTLSTPKMESKPPFSETENITPAEFKKTATIGTQTEDVSCKCGGPVYMMCSLCDRGMVRSNGNYDLAALGARRKSEEDEKVSKKLKCDKYCDNISIVSNNDIIKRPKLRRVLPIVDKIERIVNDRAKERDIEVLKLDERDSVFSKPREIKRQKTYSVGEDYVLYEKCDYGSFDCSNEESPKEEIKDIKFPETPTEGGVLKGDVVPSLNEMDKFRWRFDSAASMVFHSKTGLPLTSSPAPLRRGNNCFDFDDSINGISGIKSALFHPTPETPDQVIPETPEIVDSVPTTPPPKKKDKSPKLRIGPSTCLLGSFEESALKGRLEPVATVHGFTAELGAYGSFCPPHKKLPVTVFFYAPGGTNAPYMGHINLSGGYRVPLAGTIQLSLFNPHGTLVKMFVVLYELSRMPAGARTFLRQRTHALPPGQPLPPPKGHSSLRYLIHLRFMTSKSGKLYLHTDIRIIVSRKADLDTATAHSALFRPLPTSDQEKSKSDQEKSNSDQEKSTSDQSKSTREPNRVFGGCSEFDFSNDNQNVAYELRSFTYAPDNPRYSPR